MLTEIADLREFKIFEELDDQELDSIAKIARLEELGKGAYLTRTDSPASNLYLVKKGLVTILAPGPHGKEVPVEEVGPGNVVGWSTVTGPYIYKATSMTAEESTLIVISGKKLRHLFEINNHVGYRVLKGIGYVVSRRLTAIEAKCAAHSSQKD